MSSSAPIQLHAIVAMAENRVIGQGMRIPWHLPEDFRWFKQTTMGHVLLMGRRTFQSIGRALPGRETLVLTLSGFTHPGVRTLGRLDQLPELVPGRRVFVCGGAEVYRLALPFCSDLFVTQVRAQPEGDVWFPPFEDRFAPVECVMERPEFYIMHYRNRRPEVLKATGSGAG